MFLGSPDCQALRGPSQAPGDSHGSALSLTATSGLALAGSGRPVPGVIPLTARSEFPSHCRSVCLSPLFSISHHCSQPGAPTEPMLGAGPSVCRFWKVC